MSDQSETQSAAGGRPYERCLCRELLDQFRAHLGVSPEVRQHFNNSRIEFLKGIREMIDDRIEHLSKRSEQGTKIAVE